MKKIKVFFRTFGCTLNQADTLLMKKFLSREFEAIDLNSNKIDDELKKGIVVVNTCAVKLPTEQKILNYISNLQKNGIRMVIAGCLAQAYPSLIRKYTSSPLLGVDALSRINDAIKDSLQGRVTSYLERERIERLEAKQSGWIAKLPIQTGCVSNCSFCATKLARSVLWSAEEEKIIKKIKEAAAKGAREICLTGQDLGAYGIERKKNIAQLMKKIGEECKEYEDKIRIRIGMMNPEHVKNFINELLEAYEYKIFYKFAHIPLQSGSDRILELMRRNYKKEEFLQIAKALKEKGIGIATDIIVGFPTEKEEEFEETLEVLKEIKPIVTNVSKFSLRKGTLASKMEQLPNKTIKERSVEASLFVRKLQFQNNQEQIGKVFDVLVSEKKEKSSEVKGRNEKYQQVVVKAKTKERWMKVRIISATSTSLIGIPFEQKSKG
ncbi:MAG: tRNA (N(6)-L-threonylcarbamoyladenosine(37)-C(2))-methylthiotransferase [Candidatus Micrarchaeia archaeon]